MAPTSKYYKTGIKGGNTLAKMNPELSKELANPEDAHLIHYQSSKRVDWKCEKGHVWTVDPANRIRCGSGCPFCSNKRVLIGFNDLWTTEPELCIELANPEDGYKYTRRSGAQLDWECLKGHVWDARVSTRKNGSGCSICTNRMVLPGFNDLKTTDPELFAQLVDKTLLITRGHGKKVTWQCSAGHSWESTPNNRTNLNTLRGCPYCDKTQTSKSERILRELLKDSGYDVNIDHTHRLSVTGWSRKTAQVDVCFEHGDNKFVVEYDGAYWHSTRRDKDLEKTLMLLSNGYHVVRIAGQTNNATLEPLPINDHRLLSLEITHSSDNTMQLESVVRKITDWVAEFDSPHEKD